MIVNGRQYAISERKLLKCISLRKKLIIRLNRAVNKEDAQNEIDNLQRQAQLITKHMKEYVALNSGRIAPPDLSDIRNLPHNLIRARISIGWSPLEFAKQCSVAPSQVHRWESTHYASVSLHRILSVAELLNCAMQQQKTDARLLNAPLKLGADWFDSDFRQLADNQEPSRMDAI